MIRLLFSFEGAAIFWMLAVTAFACAVSNGTIQL